MSAFLRVIKRLLPRRPRCILGAGCVVYPTASIVNPRIDPALIRIGVRCHIKGELLLFGHGGCISMGDYCYVGPNSYVWSARDIRIGNRVLISHNCNIFDSDTHPIDALARHEQFKAIISSGQPKEIDLNERAVVIEDDVLVGANVIILKGVTIGRGAIVGAGSVVTRDVPPFCIVAGNPAHVVRKLVEDAANGR